MTTPTQAQIEAEELCAALDKMAQRFGARFAPDQQKVAAYVAALTAAAEVGNQVMTPSREPETAVIRPDRDAVSLELLGRDREIARLQNEIDNGKIATIERCAQVAEWEGYATVGRQIAAEIRAMKDNAVSDIDRRAAVGFKF